MSEPELLRISNDIKKDDLIKALTSLKDKGEDHDGQFLDTKIERIMEEQFQKHLQPLLAKIDHLTIADRTLNEKYEKLEEEVDVLGKTHQEKILEEMEHRLRRRNYIIIAGAKESDIGNPDERMEADKRLVSEVMSEIGCENVKLDHFFKNWSQAPSQFSLDSNQMQRWRGQIPIA